VVAERRGSATVCFHNVGLGRYGNAQTGRRLSPHCGPSVSALDTTPELFLLHTTREVLLLYTAAMAGLIEQLDAAIADLLTGWNLYSSLLVVGIIGFIAFVIYDTQDADTHPLLLARQAQAAYIRQPGESPAFRSPETPHGCTFLPAVQQLPRD
jgi:hypothetical protein